jgi:hypothetical protein
VGAGRQRRAWSLKMTSWLTGNLSSSTIDKYALQYAHECNRTWSVHPIPTVGYKYAALT